MFRRRQHWYVLKSKIPKTKGFHWVARFFYVSPEKSSLDRIETFFLRWFGYCTAGMSSAANSGTFTSVQLSIPTEKLFGCGSSRLSFQKPKQCLK